jgi:CRISPR-associated protein Csb1
LAQVWLSMRNGGGPCPDPEVGSCADERSHDDPVGIVSNGRHTLTQITYELMRSSLLAGGPSVLVSTTELAPAAGPHAAVAPARFVPKGQQGAVYAYECRYVDGEPCQVAIIDSKQSQLNRAEIALQQALLDGHPVIGRLPHVTVTYERDGVPEVFTDLTLPHRAYDGHIRAGSVSGVPVTQTPEYRAVRDASPADARALLEFSPITLAFGGWDASRRSRQGRWRSALVGEIIGVLADRHADTRTPAMRGGARVDPVAMQVNLDGPTLKAFADAQRDELSPDNYEKIVKAAAKSKDGGTSASALGLGGIPPTLDQLAGVACSRIMRSHVLSLATLRQIRFGTDPQGDAACRALLAALALNGLARSDAELCLRANCDLVEASPTRVVIDMRAGEHQELEPLGIEAADELLAQAIERAASDFGIRWNGQVFAVTGNPAVVSGATDTDAES